MKVLMIDDSPDALAIAKARLIKDDIEVICTADGPEGLDSARRENPDLVLLDVDMPDMSGFDVCRALKADSELCMIPVIFLSGSGDAEDKVKGLNLGAVDYVTKPFDAFELRARVNAALRTKHMQDLLIEYAKIDPLTGLANRRALMERLGQEWARVQRHGGTLSFIMGDIDNFKQVNDTNGHAAGDEVLRCVANVLVNRRRRTDLPVRYGGDEFAVLLPDESVQSAAALAERCREEIENIRIRAGQNDVSVTASFGVADTTNVSSAEALIKSADIALYRAKQEGRNRVAVAPPEESAP